MANKKSKFQEKIISKMSKADKDNSDPSDITSQSPPVEMPQVQESISVNKEIVKENRILNENLTLLSSTIQNLVKGMEKTLGESTKRGPSGIQGSTPSKSPYNRRNVVDAERIGDSTQQDMESKTPKDFGQIIREWRADKKENLKETFTKAITPSQWDIRPILEVDKGSGSLADRLVSNREARRAKELEQKEFVKNAVKFGNVDEATAKEQYNKVHEAQSKTSEINKRITEAKQAGYAPSRDDLQARNQAVREQIELDPRKAIYANQDRRYKDTSNNRIDLNPIPLPPKPTLAGTELSETESESAVVTASIGETLKASLETQKELLSLFKEYFKEGKGKSEDKDGKGASGESESGGSVLETAKDVKDLVGKRGGKLLQGAKKALPMLKNASGFIGRNAGKLGAAAGVAAGAYEAYTGWGDANEQLQKGEITETQADEKKGEAVGGGAGGAAGAWAGAAAGAAVGSVVPIVGTAVGGLIGGTLGYMAGSGLGKKVGGSLVSGYKSVKGWFGGEDKEEEKPPVPVKPLDQFNNVSSTPSTSENTPPSMQGLGGGGVALANGNDTQLGEKIEAPKPPELQTWANKPPANVKWPNPEPSGSDSLLGRIGGVGLRAGQAVHDNVNKLKDWFTDDKRSVLQKAGDVIMAPTRAIGAVGLKAGEAISGQAGKLKDWFTDDKRSALQKVGDVALAPAMAISNMTLGAGGKIKEGFDSLFGDGKNPEELRTWANKPPANVKWPTPDKSVTESTITPIKPSTSVEQSGRYIDRTTSDIVSAKEAKTARESNTSVVNAPTTINNNTTNVGPPLPIRNPENTQSRYIGSRFAF